MQSGKICVWMTLAVLGLALQARAVLVESWETGANGWQTSPENAAWSITGNSATGATNGTQSLQLSGAAALTYGQLFFSPASVDNTTLLGNGASLSVDVFLNDIGAFGFFQQWTASVNQTGGGGYDSLDNFTYTQSGATGQKTLTWSIPAAIANDLLVNPTLPTSIHFQVGSGGDATTVRSIFVDNVRIEPVPEPAAVGLLAIGGLLALRRRGR